MNNSNIERFRNFLIDLLFFEQFIKQFTGRTLLRFYDIEAATACIADMMVYIDPFIRLFIKITS